MRRYADGTVSLFDNEGGPPNEATQSRGLLLSVDEKTREAQLVRQCYHSPPVLSEALGSVQELGGGRIFMGWGDSSYFTEYDPTGKVVFDGRLTPGTESYRAFRQTWSGQPSAQVPAMAVVRGPARPPFMRATTAVPTWPAGWCWAGPNPPSSAAWARPSASVSRLRSPSVPLPPTWPSKRWPVRGKC